MRPDLLQVVAVYANPQRWKARLANFKRFEDHMLKSGVGLTTVECTYGDRPFELTGNEQTVTRVQLRARDVLWHKENLGNIGLARAPASDYYALVDGDFTFIDPNWATETVHMLQLHPIVQISSELIFLGPNNEHLGRGTSLLSLYQQARSEARPLTAEQYYDEIQVKTHGYPGGAWAYRRSALDDLGGLLDICIVGAGDHHMAQGLLGLSDRLAAPTNAGSAYSRRVNIWRDRAAAKVKNDIGLVPGLAMHHWHGKTADRHYPNRWRILQRASFDPDTDLIYDHQGLLQLAGNKPHLRDDMRAYFSARNEDSIDV